MTKHEWNRDLTGQHLILTRRQWPYEVVHSGQYNGHWVHTVDILHRIPEAQATGCHRMVANTPQSLVFDKPIPRGVGCIAGSPRTSSGSLRV